MGEVQKRLDLAINWLLNSGIQNKDGGINSWYDPNSRRYPYIYSEITGYGVSTLSYLYDRYKKQVFLKSAIKSGDWLLKNIKKGTIKSIYEYKKSSRKTICSYKQNTYHSFDNGVILKALLDLYSITKENKYISKSYEIAEKLAGMQKSTGLFHPIFDADKKKFIDEPFKWSTQSGPYHAKIAMGLTEFHNITREDWTKKSAIKICEAILRKQLKEGRFVTYADKETTHVHPHCYALEGLIFTGINFRRSNFLAAAEDGIQWMFDNQKENGGIGYSCNNLGFSPFERTDVLAQMYRLGFLLKKMPELKLDQLLNRLLQYQYTTGPKKIKGAFKFGYDLNGQRLDHANAWCTMFAIQAMDWKLNGLKGDII